MDIAAGTGRAARSHTVQHKIHRSCHKKCRTRLIVLVAIMSLFIETPQASGIQAYFAGNPHLLSLCLVYGTGADTADHYAVFCDAKLLVNTSFLSTESLH